MVLGTWAPTQGCLCVPKTGQLVSPEPRVSRADSEVMAQQAALLQAPRGRDCKRAGDPGLDPEAPVLLILMGQG